MKTRTAVRPPAVAGSFYPGNAAELKQGLAGLLAQACSAALPAPQALIVPHAGYVYSGPTAAVAYRQLDGIANSIHRIVLLGPAHRVYLEGMALPAVSRFATPLGEVLLDPEAMTRARGLPGVVIDAEAHRLEHALEVQLPFLQHTVGDFSLIPVLIGQCPAATVAGLIDTLWAEPGVLLVVSSDLSHFQSYEEASRHDAHTCRRILAGEHELSGSDACGAGCINGLLASDRGRRLRRAILSYSNSGDTGGDRQRVVGYGAFSLH